MSVRRDATIAADNEGQCFYCIKTGPISTENDVEQRVLGKVQDNKKET